MEKAETARALFQQGYNCAQSVFGAFAPELGIDRETAFRLASGFGAGMGRMRQVCGAVSGMILAAGLAQGYSDPTRLDEKTATYAMIQQLAHEFEQANGSIICQTLLGLARPEGTAQAEARTAEYYRKRPCADLVAQAAGILESYLQKAE